MKFFLPAIFLTLAACLNTVEKSKSVIEGNAVIHSISAEDISNGVIYEANIRQYSPEGSFNAFTKDLQVLKELGVKIIWLMPINPISTTKSKGPLGSYYAVSDYKKLNSEFGTELDFRNLVDKAHELGISIILHNCSVTMQPG